MICEECGIRPAKFHIMTIANDVRTERNLCPVCMAKYRRQMPGLDFSNLAGILSGLLGERSADQSDADQALFAELSCPECGMTYADFRKCGMLGCAHCYQAFKTPLDALLQRIHGTTQHAGRIPGNVREGVNLRVSIDRLRQKLQLAVADEDYEQAALLRDNIRALVAQLAEEERNGVRAAQKEARRKEEGGERE